jgi:aminoglycoside phosphotransferase (APT) family kinase protein
MDLDGIDDWPFYVVFSAFRFAAIVQGILKRAMDGNASNDKALAVGALARPLAEMAVRIIDDEYG